MNLGDGLLFELENGKPKLILLRRGAEQGPAKQPSSKPRAANILTPRQPSCLDHVQLEHPAGQQAGRHQDARAKARAGETPFPSRTTSDSGRGSTGMASKTRENHTAVGGISRSATKVKPDQLKHNLRANGQIQNGGKNNSGKVGLKDTLVSGDIGLKDGMVCLTREQLQQILTSVQSSRSDQHTSEDLKIQSSATKESVSGYSENEGGNGEMKERGGGEDIRKGPVTDMTGLSQDKNDRRELHNSRSSGLFSWLEEHQSDGRAAMDAKKAQWRRELNEQVALKQQQQCLETGRLQGDEDTGSVLSVHSSLSHRDQPAAIRSSLKLGEFIPMEELLSVERREEEKRRWLEELDQQREEATERRKQEKLLQNQTEDHELWATHFDSLQRRPPTRTAAPSVLPPPGPLCGSERREWEPSSSLSMAWDTTSSCEAESVAGASVDMASRYPPRNGFLRTMTALLDPVQLEEKERRRVKQLEHQKVLLAQIEERRQQKEQDEQRRRFEQEEEERRLEQEREKILRQYKMDTQMERRKEEQEKKDQGKAPEPQQPSAARQTEHLPEKIDSTDVSHKHIAVQTVEAGGPAQPATGTLQTPEVAAANRQPAPAPPPQAPSNRGTRAGRTGKENICLSGEGGDAEAGGGDPYEAFARTNRNRKEMKRPEWNSQRPARQFVPASKRYPAPLQKNRRESREKRKAELLALQERSCVRSDPPPHPPPQTKIAPRKVESVARNQTNSATVNPERGHSPPVPAVRHRVQSQQSSPASPPPLSSPTPELVPFIRTEEVLNLDPVESANGPLPHTAAPPQSSASSPANSHRDVLLHPELLRNARTPRQQEILRGLAQLRQGLLQKQKELEMDLYP